MEDNKQTTQADVETPTTTASNEDKKVDINSIQEELNKVAAKVRAEEKAKRDKEIQEAIAEYERRAKLSEEEREKEAKSKREAELKEREEEITLRERRIEAQELLSAKKIPVELVDFVIDLDESKTKDNIEKLASTYSKSVEAGITSKLKGNPPTDFSNNNDTDKQKKVMSAF